MKNLCHNVEENRYRQPRIKTAGRRDVTARLDNSAADPRHDHVLTPPATLLGVHITYSEVSRACSQNGRSEQANLLEADLL